MKKIIALTVAITVIISILNITAYAEFQPPVYFKPEYIDYIHTSDTMSTRDYELYQYYLIEDYTNNYLTYDEFKVRSEDVTNAYLYFNSENDVPSSVALNTSNTFNAVSNKIGSAVSQWGDGARERVSDWWNGVTQNVPTEDTHTSTTNMHGRGARIDCFLKNNNKHYSVLLCDYIVLDIEKSRFINRTNDGSSSPYAYVGNDGKYSFSGGAVASSWSNLNDTTLSYKLYGDVRYPDGTPAPSDDEWIYTGTIKKFDDMSERELEDLLNDFSEEMDLQNPDLSSIDGLLNAIYARMGTLDSDNDNELLASINANILALLEADNKKDEDEENTNEELIKTLLEIRDSLKNGTLGTAPSSHGHEISGTVYNVIPLDKEWLDNMLHNRTNLKVNYQGTIYYLENCGCLKLGNKYYTPNMNYDEYSADYYDIDDLPSFTFDSTYTYSNGDVQPFSMAREGLPPVDDFLNAGNSAIQPYIDKAINEMAKAFTIGIPYDDIKSSIGTFQSIVFNNYEPKDVVVTINGQVVTILSVDFSTYLTGGSSSGGGIGNNFNYSDLINGGSNHGGGGSGGNRENDYNNNSPDIVTYSDDNNVSVSTPALAPYVKIVRTLSSIFIGFSWALSMRRKIVAMI